MMHKYINAEQLEDVVTELNSKGWGITRGEFKLIDGVLFEFPAADVVEVRHGRWKDKNGGRWIFCPMCSECEEAFYEMPVNLKGEIVHNYCPNCGSKLEIDKNYNKDK